LDDCPGAPNSRWLWASTKQPPEAAANYHGYRARLRVAQKPRGRGLAVGAACAFSLGIAGQVLTFRTRAWSIFAPPTRRMPLGRSQVILRASSRRMGHPPVLTSPNRISTLLQRFACARLSRPCLPGSSSRRFHNVHHHAFDNSSLRWLGIGSRLLVHRDRGRDAQ